jgi:LEA14-like dessication related protein
MSIFTLLVVVSLSCGCLESPIKEPTVSVSNITLSDVSLQTMTVNTTVVINNPNPIGAKLNKVAFDIYYIDDTWNYLGHGEKSDIEVKDNGNTTVIIPVVIGNIQAINAMGSLLKKGSITLNVNGSAFIDIKVTSYEKRFEQNKVFQLSDFTGLLPVNTIPGTSINITDKLQQIGGLLKAVS